jgi:hypothetical protein
MEMKVWGTCYTSLLFPFTGWEKVELSPLQIRFNTRRNTRRTPIRVWDIVSELIINSTRNSDVLLYIRDL